jgi:hypothetical protein
MSGLFHQQAKILGNDETSETSLFFEVFFSGCLLRKLCAHDNMLIISCAGTYFFNEGVVLRTVASSFAVEVSWIRYLIMFHKPGGIVNSVWYESQDYQARDADSHKNSRVSVQQNFS